MQVAFNRHLEWPLAVRVCAFALALPAASMEAIDILILLWQRSGAPGWLFYAIHWLALPAFFVWAAVCARFGAQGLYFLFAGAVIAWFVLENFRGAYARFGTFENWQETPTSWLVPTTIGSACGLIAGFLQRPLADFPPRPLILALTLVWITAIASMAAVLFVPRAAVDWMPTVKWIALALLALVLTIPVLILGRDSS